MVLLFCIDREIGRTAVCHIVRVRPDLLHTKSVSFEVADIHMRIFPRSDLIIDRTAMVIVIRCTCQGNSIGVVSGISFCRIRAGAVSGVVVIIIYIFLEGITVRNLCRTFLHPILRSCQDLPDFYGIVNRDPGNRTVHGSAEACGDFLLR